MKYKKCEIVKNGREPELNIEIYGLEDGTLGHVIVDKKNLYKNEYTSKFSSVRVNIQ